MTIKTQVTDSNGRKVSRVLRPSTTYKLATGGTAGPLTHGDVIRVTVDGDSHFLITDTAGGTAAVTDVFISDGIVEYFKVEGTYLYVAGLGGNTYVTVMV